MAAGRAGTLNPRISSNRPTKRPTFRTTPSPGRFVNLEFRTWVVTAKRGGIGRRGSLREGHLSEANRLTYSPSRRASVRQFGMLGGMVVVRRPTEPVRAWGRRQGRCLGRGHAQEKRCLPSLTRECRNQADGRTGAAGRRRGFSAGDGPGAFPGLHGVGHRGSSRRSSTMASSSPRCSKAARITAASASVTTIMPAGRVCHRSVVD